jgi:hypothetical protein
MSDEKPSLVPFAVLGGLFLVLFGGNIAFEKHRKGQYKKGLLAHKKARKAMGHVGRLEDQLEHRKEVVEEHREEARDLLRFAKKETEHVRALESKIARLKAKS